MVLSGLKIVLPLLDDELLKVLKICIYNYVKIVPYSGKCSREKMFANAHFANQRYCPIFVNKKTRHSRIIFSRIACNSQKFPAIRYITLVMHLSPIPPSL